MPVRPPIRIVQSQQNPRLKELRRALSRPAGSLAAGGLVGIEGPNLLEEALRAGLGIECVFMAQGAEKLLDRLPLPAGTEILLVPKPLLDAALTTETPQPVAALVEPPQWTWERLFGGREDGRESGPALLLVLAGLQDPGNLGTILRSAEAFGATGIISLPGTVSAWNPKAVRASAGSVFRVPVVVAKERECFERLREAGVKVYAAMAREAAPAGKSGMTGPIALLIGNEGSGISSDLAAKADARITIPCPGPVESLNAAVATSVLLYETAQQRAALRSEASGPSGQSRLRKDRSGVDTENRGARR